MSLPLIDIVWAVPLEESFIEVIATTYENAEEESIRLLSKLEELFVWADVEFPSPQTVCTSPTQFRYVSGGQTIITPSASILTKENIEFSIGVHTPYPTPTHLPPILILPDRLVLNNLEITGYNKEGVLCNSQTFTFTMNTSSSLSMEDIKLHLKHSLYLKIVVAVQAGAEETL